MYTTFSITEVFYRKVESNRIDFSEESLMK